MKFKGTIIGQASGSYASNTFSHNRGGQYIRNRSIPVNPNSTQQQAVRNAMNLYANRWRTALTQAQRDGWAAYSAAVPIPDSLGEPRDIGGIAMYSRNNIPRRQSGLSAVNAAPAALVLGTVTPPTITGIAATGIASVVFDNTDEWATAVGGALLLYFSRGANSTRTANQGGYRYGFRINGAVVPPASPGTGTMPFGVTAGQKVFWQARAVTADGKLTGKVNGAFIAT